jgi:glycosyltransferase involved in cell wall biosynthesis
MALSRRQIAVVCPGSGAGGSVAAVALRQAAGLASSFDVMLLSDSHPAEPIGRVKYLRIRPPSFRWLRRYGHVPRELAFTRHVRRVLFGLALARDLDFVLCHGHAVAALCAAPVQASWGVPYGLVTHGDIFDRPLGTYDPRLTWFYKKVTPKAYRHANLIVALSPHMQALAQQGGAANDSIRVIPNGIDPSEFGLELTYISPPPLAPDLPLRILFVGRLALEKGVDTLLQACKRLVEQNIPLQLRVVGDGPLLSELQVMAVTLGLGDCSSFVGPLPRHALGTEYLGCHVVCVPSRSDPFPTVVLEALAAGRCVIGTDVGGIPFAVEHENSGLLVKREAPGELADALERVSRNPQMLEAMGRQGQARAQTHFKWQRVTEQLIEAIEAAIKPRIRA